MGIFKKYIYGSLSVRDNITGDTLTLSSITNDNALTQILGRNSTTGDVEYRDVSSIVPSSDLGNMLFVATTGNDFTGTKGDIHKPYRNLYAAKSASTSGDTVYVFPGTWTYDNTDAAGNPYNGNMDTLVNLWKDGVSYYFSPNSKIIFYNQTVTGENMNLFISPNTATTVQSCSVYGELEWEGSSIGVNTSNGGTGFHTISGFYENAYRFTAKVKSLISKSSGILYAGMYGYTGNTDGYFRLDADLVELDYVGGQSGNGGAIAVQCDGNCNISINIKELKSSIHPFYMRSDSYNEGTRFVANVDYMNSGSFAILQRHSIGEEFIFNIKNGTFGSCLLLSENGTSGTTIINGNFKSITDTTTSILILQSTIPNTLIFNGLIKPDTTSGAGRRIISTSNSNQNVILNCDILYDSDLSTTSRIFEVNGGEVTFNGNINGNFGGPIARVRDGKLIIKDSNINSTITGTTLFNNDVTTSTGTTSLRGSTVLLNNSTSDLHNGEYLNTYVLNSNIKNSGSSDIFTNTTSNGLLQIQNSSLVCVSGTTINIGGTSSVVVSNSSSNTSISATTISGTITELTELDIE